MILLLAMFALFLQNPITSLSGKQYLVVSFIVSVTIYFSKHFKLKSNPFSGLGDYSYALYLIHVPLGVYSLGLLKKGIFETNVWMNLGLDLINFSFVLVIATLIFKYIENPSIKFGKELAKKLF